MLVMRSSSRDCRPVGAAFVPAPVELPPPGRHCNLLLVCKRRLHEHEDFVQIAENVRRMAPDVRPLLISDHLRNAFRPDAWMRPSLAVSNEGLRHFRPLRGPLFQGRQLPKSEEYAILEKAGIPVPKWTLVTADREPDMTGFGKYVVSKPDLSACGAEVKIKRATRIRPQQRVCERYQTVSQAIAQEFIYTGPWPVSYRVSTFFGRVLYAWRVEADRSRRPLREPEAFAGGPQDGGISIASSGKGCTFELIDDAEILALAQRAHAAFARWPLLGVDIVREEPTGKLYVLEVNSCGNTWHFSSTRGLSIQQGFGLDFRSQFDAPRTAAAVLVEQVRLYAA
jgi:hypothetical protein